MPKARQNQQWRRQAGADCPSRTLPQGTWVGNLNQRRLLAAQPIRTEPFTRISGPIGLGGWRVPRKRDEQASAGTPDPAARSEAKYRWRSRADRKDGSKASTVLQSRPQGRQQSTDGTRVPAARLERKCQRCRRVGRKTERMASKVPEGLIARSAKKAPTVYENQPQGRKEDTGRCVTGWRPARVAFARENR